MRICAECKHFKNLEKGLPPDSVFYNLMCMADISEKKQDPVTGKMVFAGQNDLGQEVPVIDGHPYCRDMNHGDCQFWETKE